MTRTIVCLPGDGIGPEVMGSALEVLDFIGRKLAIPLEIETCPFANLPERKRTQSALTRAYMKTGVWLKPNLVAQLEFTGWTPDNHLRFKVCRTER